jgi:hypothetical protein
VLRANVGRSVEIKTHDDKEWMTAEILSMPDVAPTLPQQRSTLLRVPPGRGDLILLRTESGVTAISPSRIVAVRLGDGEYGDTITRESTVPVVRFDVGRGRGNARRFEISYLAQGIAWSPSYVVAIDDEEKARISAKAVLVNDLTDLMETDVELISGYPSIEFAAVRSPMSLEPLGQLLDQVRSAGARGAMLGNDAIFRQRVDYYAETEERLAYPTMPTTPVAGEDTEDLYFYSLPDVTLKRGERGYFGLFAEDVPYTDLYTWDIPDYVDQEDRYQAQTDGAAEVVWHALRLTNTTGQPWTTAPAMTMKDGRVLGQATLPFTPRAGTSRLRITRAVSIRAEQEELEVQRTRDAARFHGYSYDEVIVEGTLKLTNFKPEDVTVEVTKEVSGEVGPADGSPEVVRLAKGMRRVNPRSRLSWNVDVPAGSENGVMLKYRYTFYTR